MEYADKVRLATIKAREMRRTQYCTTHAACCKCALAENVDVRDVVEEMDRADWRCEQARMEIANG